MLGVNRKADKSRKIRGFIRRESFLRRRKEKIGG